LKVGKAIELYEKYMVDLERKGNADEKTETSAESYPEVGEAVTGRKEEKVSGEHPGSGSCFHGVRGRARKPGDAERVSEESEECNPSPRFTRYVESTLGIKSYSELAPSGASRKILHKKHGCLTSEPIASMAGKIKNYPGGSMKKSELTLPEIALIAGTRGMIGAGAGLLLADRLDDDQRRAIGWTLLIIGAISTIPLAIEVLSKRH